MASSEPARSLHWRPCADARLLAALPSLRILLPPPPASQARLSASPTEPHLLRLEDGTETPGLGLLALRPGRTLYEDFAVDFDPSAGLVVASPASELPLHVDGVEVPPDSQPGRQLHPGSLIVSGRCLYLFAWSGAQQGPGERRFLAGHAEVAALRRENSDLAARARDLLEAAERADGLAVRVSAALGRMEAALFGSSSCGPQQRNDSCCSAVVIIDKTAPPCAQRSRRLSFEPMARLSSTGGCWAGEAARLPVLQSPPEVHRAAAHRLTRLGPPPPAASPAEEAAAKQLEQAQFLMGVSADIGDKLVGVLAGINRGCDQQWLFDGLSDIISEISWALSISD